jgi:allantoin racemase
VRLAIINPTTTAAFASKNLEAAERVAAAGTEILSVTVASGPPSIEDHLDEAVAAVAIVEEIQRLEAQAVNAYVIACFGDPGIWAAREITDAPVIGIAEAAFHAVTIVATHFSVVTTLGRTRVMCEHLLHIFGFAHRCRRIRAVEVEVLALEDTGLVTFNAIEEECRKALDEDGSDALVLGCAGMADLSVRLQDRLGVPVIDGVASGVKLVESLVALGYGTSKRGDLAAPLPKTYSGRFAFLSPTRAYQG